MAMEDTPVGEAAGASRPDLPEKYDPSAPETSEEERAGQETNGQETFGEPDPSEFLIGAEAVRAFVAREWKRQLDCRLKKEVWTYSGDQVSILFEYEWHDAESGRWISTYGEEHWEIAPDGLMRRLSASGRDIVIDEVQP